MFKKISIAILLLATSSAISFDIQAAHAKSFNSAKTSLKKIYNDNDKTFYCGCDMIYNEKKKLIPVHQSCGFKYRKNKKRSERTEWEHVLTAWDFGHQMQCWQEGGRKACGKVKEFKIMESDIHNLVPAIGEVNGDRSNRPLAMVASPIKNQYGQCDVTVSFEEDRIMPRASVRGDVARIMFYMYDRYNLRMSKQDYNLYKAWNNQDPVSKDEIRIHNLKHEKQGNPNPFVTGAKSVNDYKR